MIASNNIGAEMEIQATKEFSYWLEATAFRNGVVESVEEIIWYPKKTGRMQSSMPKKQNIAHKIQVVERTDENNIRTLELI